MNDAERSQLATRFMALFPGRTDVWGAVHGKCVTEELTLSHWTDHLFGHGSLGIYPLLGLGDGLWVRWGCTDLDQGYDMLALAANVWRALKALGITSWVEKSKGKGYHVWVLAADWVAAEAMRNALLFAHQLVELPPREVNPKQVTLDGLKGFGNYVNLPYAQDWYLGKGTRLVLDMERPARTPMSLREFVAAAEQSLNSPQVIAAAAARFTPPPPPIPVAYDAYDGSLEPLVARMGGLTRKVFVEGPLPNDLGHIDRSAGLQKLAYLVVEDGFEINEAMAILVDADSRWGKYGGRPDGQKQLDRILGRGLTAAKVR